MRARLSLYAMFTTQAPASEMLRTISARHSRTIARFLLCPMWMR